MTLDLHHLRLRTRFNQRSFYHQISVLKISKEYLNQTLQNYCDNENIERNNLYCRIYNAQSLVVPELPFEIIHEASTRLKEYHFGKDGLEILQKYYLDFLPEFHSILSFQLNQKFEVYKLSSDINLFGTGARMVQWELTSIELEKEIKHNDYVLPLNSFFITFFNF